MNNELVENIFKTRDQINHNGNGMNSLIGNGNVMTTPGYEEMVRQEAINKFNDEVEGKKLEWEQKLKDQEQHAKEIDEKMQDMEIMPINSYVLVQPFAKNPFQKMKQIGSIVIPEYEGAFKNPDSGMEDFEDNLSCQAVVIEVSPSCRYVKEGDVVYYRKVNGVPIPFFGQGYEVVAEQQIQVVINSGLKERFENLNK